MAAAAVQQLAATARILSKLAGRPSFQKVSAAERHRVQVLLQDATLTSEEIATVLDAVGESHLAPEDSALLLDFVAEKMCGEAEAGQRSGSGASSSSSGAVAPPASLAGRGAMQSWEHMAKYLPDSLWEKLAAGDMTSFLDHLIRMGLRRPSEPTSTTMAIVCIVATEGDGKLTAMSSDDRLRFVQALKLSFKARAKGLPPPAIDCASLPADPTDFKAKFPTLWNSAFESDGPAESRISEATMAMHRCSTRMRKTKAVAPMQLQLQQPSGDAFIQFGQGLLSQMQNLASAVSQIQKPQLPNLKLMNQAGMLPEMQTRRHLPQLRDMPAPQEPPQPMDQLALLAPARADTAASPEAAAIPMKKRSIADITEEIQAELEKNKAKNEKTTATKANAKSKAKPTKAKAKTTSKAVAKVKGGNGCSKCRYSERGCARCRSA